MYSAEPGPARAMPTASSTIRTPSGLSASASTASIEVMPWMKIPIRTAFATVPIPGGNVAILASDAVDTEAEAKRAAAERTRLEAEIKRAQGKLANEGFTAKAPPPVVQAERDKLARLQSELDALG